MDIAGIFAPERGGTVERVGGDADHWRLTSAECNKGTNTDKRRLTTGIRSEKCVVRRFRRCANVIVCTYTNLDSTV